MCNNSWDVEIVKCLKILKKYVRSVRYYNVPYLYRRVQWIHMVIIRQNKLYFLRNSKKF